MEEGENLNGNEVSSLARRSSQALMEPEALDISAEESPNLLDYWHLIMKRRWAVLTCLFFVFSTITIGTLKQKPVYEGKVLIEINSEDPNVLNFQEILRIDAGNVDSYRETQYKILGSRNLAERVIQDLHLYRLPEFYRTRKFFGLVEADPENIPSSADPGPPDPQSDAYRNAIARFLDSTSISPVRNSDLVEVSFYSHDRNLAARVANQLASHYIDRNLEVKWDETVKASEWLQGQLTGLKAKLEKSEDALQAYARAHSILFVEEKKNLTSARLEQLQQEYTRAQAERFQKEALFGLVEQGRVQDLPGFLNNGLVQSLTIRLADLERDYAQLTATVKPEYPKAIGVKKQIDSLSAELDRHKSTLSQNIDDEYRAAVARERYLADALEQQKDVVNDIADRTIQYNILKREADTNRQLFEGLLQRLKEAQVSAGLKASNIRVVDAAQVPKGPVKPRVILNLGLGVILGVGLGIGLAFFQEYLDVTIKNPDEVEKLLRLPSLGVIPIFASNGSADAAEETSLSVAQPDPKPMVAAIQTNAAAVEAFRSLRTSILLSANPVPKMLLVTSALPGEGKTTTSVNLGATLASLGSRVLIVDCDMRRPSCHLSTGVKNSPGFVQCMTGHVELQDAILAVPGVPNLSVIPCGPIPPNPAEVLSSPLASELLRKLRGEFEYVIVDSPPLLSVADARILSTVSDAVVLVVRANETPYDVARRARALLYAAGARILGVALNDVDFRRDGYGYGYKGRYYRYGYGYGYGEGRGEGSFAENSRPET